MNEFCKDGVLCTLHGIERRLGGKAGDAVEVIQALVVVDDDEEEEI